MLLPVVFSIVSFLLSFLCDVLPTLCLSEHATSEEYGQHNIIMCFHGSHTLTHENDGQLYVLPIRTGFFPFPSLPRLEHPATVDMHNKRKSKSRYKGESIIRRLRTYLQTPRSLSLGFTFFALTLQFLWKDNDMEHNHL